MRHPVPVAQDLQGIGCSCKPLRMRYSKASDSLFSSEHLAGSNGPDFLHEQKLIARGYKHVAGMDEAGRGPLAGPVVAAAVILDPANIPDGLNDSKTLSAKRREQLFEEILAAAVVGIAVSSAIEIDRTDIRKASLRAMVRASQALAVKADYGLVDGRDIPPGLACHAMALIKGDARSQSIAAASIIAKVCRDRMMIRAAEIYPAYSFEKHKGYGSVLHIEAIKRHGPCPLHRMSFRPLRQD